VLYKSNGVYAVKFYVFERCTSWESEAFQVCRGTDQSFYEILWTKLLRWNFALFPWIYRTVAVAFCSWRLNCRALFCQRSGSDFRRPRLIIAAVRSASTVLPTLRLHRVANVRLQRDRATPTWSDLLGLSVTADRWATSDRSTLSTTTEFLSAHWFYHFRWSGIKIVL